MLSDSLNVLAEWLRTYEQDGITMEPEAVQMMRRWMTSHANKARALEDRQQRLSAEHLRSGNVVLFPVVPRSIPARGAHPEVGEGAPAECDLDGNPSAA